MKPVSTWRSVANPLLVLLLGAASVVCAVDARSLDGEETSDQEEMGAVGLELRLGDVTVSSVR